MKRFKSLCTNLYSRLTINAPNNITIRPTSGICNRLQALSSALALGYQLDKQVRFVWELDVDVLNAPFDSLFEIIDNRLQPSSLFITTLAQVRVYRPYIDKIRARKAPLSNLLIYGTRIFLLNFLKTITRLIYSEVFIHERANIEKINHNRVYIVSNSFFYPTKLANLSYLRPIKPIQAQIDIMKRKMDPNHLVGVHIRRGDRLQSHNENPITTFIKQMQQEVDKNSVVQFFVASDSYQDKQHLKRIFGERVITYDAHLARTDVQGVQDAVVELYLLGEGKSIIGSSGSTYSRQAAMLKNIPLYRVKGDSVYKFEQLHTFDQAKFSELVKEAQP